MTQRSGARKRLAVILSILRAGHLFMLFFLTARLWARLPGLPEIFREQKPRARNIVMWAFCEPEPFRTYHGASISMRGPAGTQILILPKEAP
jgi:hypothetical protein